MSFPCSGRPAWDPNLRRPVRQQLRHLQGNRTSQRITQSGSAPRPRLDVRRGVGRRPAVSSTQPQRLPIWCVPRWEHRPGHGFESRGLFEASRTPGTARSACKYRDLGSPTAGQVRTRRSTTDRDLQSDCQWEEIGRIELRSTAYNRAQRSSMGAAGLHK